MDIEGRELAGQLEAAASQLSKMLNCLDERLVAASALSGEVERISATVEQSRREEELAARLAAAEQELAELKAARATLVAPATLVAAAAPAPANPLRKTIPAATTEMLAKRGIGEGPVDVRALDSALAGLSLEQRIAVKTQLLRAGAIA